MPDEPLTPEEREWIARGLSLLERETRASAFTAETMEASGFKPKPRSFQWSNQADQIHLLYLKYRTP